MPIQYIDGDFLKGGDDIIVHGCNCFNTMGSGAALAVKNLYKRAYYADALNTERGDRAKMGTFTMWEGHNLFHKKPITIINAYTQYGYNSQNVDEMKKLKPEDKMFSGSAFESICEKIKQKFPPSMSIGMPKIGAGRGGVRWEYVEQIIKEVLDDRMINVYVWRE